MFNLPMEHGKHLLSSPFRGGTKALFCEKRVAPKGVGRLNLDSKTPKAKFKLLPGQSGNE